VKVGGAGNMWVMNALAYSLGGLMRGMTNCIETTYTSPENGEPFLVTVTKKCGGKTPMDLRRELLDQIRSLADEGGATKEQLQAILDANQPPSNPIGLATAPDEERKTPWIRYFGDRLRCLRCLADEPIEFPCTDLPSRCNDFASRHERCLPSETAIGTVLRAMLDGNEEVGDG
jgi:hypothetical protein